MDTTVATMVTAQVFHLMDHIRTVYGLYPGGGKFDNNELEAAGGVQNTSVS